MNFTQSEFQDQLVRGLAHRMNNILTLFHGYLGLLLENQSLDKATHDGLAKIKQGASQAAELMDRTQSLVRPSSSVWRTIDLAEYLRFLRPAFEGFRGPRTQIEYDIAEDVPKVQGDSARLKCALSELVKNACEATFANGGDVKISLRCESPTGTRQRWVVFSVTDAGPGIPEELQEKIFLPFFSTKKKQNAAGLGLTLTASFVQQHKGALRIESEPGQTIAELRLPAPVA